MTKHLRGAAGGRIRKAVSVAFPITFPVLAGFLFLGFAYGVIMKTAGYSTLITCMMSVFCFCGSFQYAAVSLMAAGFNPVQMFIMCVLVNARHLFYGISLLDKYKGFGKLRFILIYLLCDESYSIIASTDPPEGVEPRLFYLSVSLLDYFYWQAGTFLGSLFGSLARFNTQGLDFVLTALFTVLFLEQWSKKENRSSCVIGVLCTAVCLIFFGAEGFILPSMACIMAVLAARRMTQREDPA